MYTRISCVAICLFAFAQCALSATPAISHREWGRRVVDLQLRMYEVFLRIGTARDLVRTGIDSKSYCDPGHDQKEYAELFSELKALRNGASSLNSGAEVSRSIVEIESNLRRIAVFHEDRWEEAQHAKFENQEEFCVLSSEISYFQFNINIAFHKILTIVFVDSSGANDADHPKA